jgi:hypothetical protein
MRYQDFPDDSLPRVRPPFSHAAVPALLGCQVKFVDDTLWAEPLAGSVEQILDLGFEPRGSFADRFISYYEYLLDQGAGRFLVNNYEIIGPLDLLAALIGSEQAVMLSVDNPDLFGKLLLHCAELGRRFSQWQESLTDNQFCWNGKLRSHLWAPAGTMHTSDHGIILYSPRVYRDHIKPAEELLYEGTNHVAFFGYFRDGAHLADDILSHEAVDFAHGCEAAPSMDFLKRHSPRVRYLIKCPVGDIPSYRAELGDAGIAYWSFCGNADQAKRIMDDLTDKTEYRKASNHHE